MLPQVNNKKTQNSTFFKGLSKYNDLEKDLKETNLLEFKRQLKLRLVFNRSFSKMAKCSVYNEKLNIIVRKNFNTLTSIQTINKSSTLLKPPLSLINSQKRQFGNHGLLWNIERIVYLCMAGAIPFGIACPCEEMDNLIAVLTTVHLHWGMEAIAIDYVRRVIFGPLIPKLTMVGLFIFSCVTLALLLDYNLNNIGILKSIRRTWEITGK